MTDYADLEKRLRERTYAITAVSPVVDDDTARNAKLFVEAADAIAALTRENEIHVEANVKLAALTDFLTRERDEAREECRQFRAALAELVRVKDRKGAEGPYLGYDSEKRAAWITARVCLSRDATATE